MVAGHGCQSKEMMWQTSICASGRHTEELQNVKPVSSVFTFQLCTYFLHFCCGQRMYSSVERGPGIEAQLMRHELVGECDLGTEAPQCTATYRIVTTAACLTGNSPPASPHAVSVCGLAALDLQRQRFVRTPDCQHERFQSCIWDSM